MKAIKPSWYACLGDAVWTLLLMLLYTEMVCCQIDFAARIST